MLLHMENTCFRRWKTHPKHMTREGPQVGLHMENTWHLPGPGEGQQVGLHMENRSKTHGNGKCRRWPKQVKNTCFADGF